MQRDLDRAFSEIARVLRPGGVLTLFDGYLTQPLAQLSADEALAAELTAKGMALDHWQICRRVVRPRATPRACLVWPDRLGH